MLRGGVNFAISTPSIAIFKILPPATGVSSTSRFTTTRCSMTAGACQLGTASGAAAAGTVVACVAAVSAAVVPLGGAF